MAETWKEIYNSEDYQSADPASQIGKRDEWLGKMKEQYVDKPDIYKMIEDKVMLKEQPSNQYGTKQAIPAPMPAAMPEKPFDINTGIQAGTPEAEKFNNIQEIPNPTVTTSTPGVAPVDEQNLISMLKWKDVRNADFYNNATPQQQHSIANAWLEKQKLVRSPEVYGFIDQKVRQQLPILDPLNQQDITGNNKTAIVNKPSEPSWVQKAGMYATLGTYDPYSRQEQAPGNIYTKEQEDQQIRENYGKAYQPMMATPEEIATAGLQPNETEKAINIAKPVVRTMQDVDALQEPGFVESMLNPAEWVGMGATGAIIAKRFGKPMMATTLDYAFNGAPAVWKGLKGFARGVSYGARGIADIAARSNSNPSKIEDLMERVLLEGWDPATLQKAAEKGKYVGQTHLEKTPELVKDTVDRLKKYAADNGFTVDEIKSMLNTGDLPQSNPSLYSVVKPMIREVGQPGLPIGTVVNQPKIGEVVQPALPGMVRQVGEGLEKGIGTIPSAGHLNPRLDSQSKTIGAFGRKVGRWIENPLRMFEKAGGNLKAEIYDKIEDADDLGVKEFVKRFAPKIKEWRSGKANSERLATYLISRQADGPDILKSMKIDTKKVLSKITPYELKVADEMGRFYKELFQRINVARIKSGLDPIGEVENYFTFYRQMDFLDSLGVNSVDTADYAKEIGKQFVKMNSTYFAEGKARGNNTFIPVELDAFKSFGRYVGHALNHINLTPEIARGQKIVSQIKNTHPELHSDITHWLNYVAGKIDHSMDDQTRHYLMGTNKRVATSLLAWNARVATAQVASLQNTYARTNVYHLVKGATQYLLDNAPRLVGQETSHRKFVMDNSNIIARMFDAASDELYGIATGKIKKYAVTAGMKPLKMIDAVVAEMSWNSFYSYGKRIGLSGKDLIRYANDEVIRTQASGRMQHLSKMQRTDVGRFLSVLQTFNINDWGFFTQDIFGMGKNVPFNKKNLGKIMRWVIGGEVITSIFEDILHTDSPAPHPVRAVVEEMNKSDPSFFNAVAAGGKEMFEKVPFIGTASRFRNSILNPTAGAIVKGAENLWKGKPWQAGLEALKITGIPVSPVSYTKRAYEYARGGKGELRGILYTPMQGREKKKKGGVKSMSSEGRIGPPPSEKKKKKKATVTIIE